MSLLPHIEINPHNPATASVIWLHGLGANGHDFEPIVNELKLPDDLAIRFIFPHAPSIPVTVNNGAVMPAWYDIESISIDSKTDTQGIINSSKQILAFVNNEISRGIASEKIILAGFSQGGAVAYEAALSFDQPLAGLMILSSYFATHNTIKLNPNNKNITIGIFHGIDDPVVPEPLAQKAINILKELKYTSNYSRYPMQHSVCVEEISDISFWLQETLKV